eukprot:TRINITY_DN4668_c0_g1_i4.p1 TRINITY_DN4668_c0_g1~~TRINITY_DN4668_c0_g1_i4.p1  ORF type:complete len:449 (+),score=56.28 TRINITY_DN4668_c0_g1_i4:895-2241(+)
MPGIPSYDSAARRWQASPPSFKGSAVTLQQIATFARELLTSDPFGTGDSVPFVNFNGPSKVVALTQRQLAFLVVNTLMGNTIRTGSGLHKALSSCNYDSIVYSLLSFLAILSRELTSGGHGTMLVGATPASQSDVWRNRLSSRTLSRPNVVNLVGSEAYETPDFMTGGTPFQALTDIAGGVVGGGGNLCGLANTQDESLVQFYSEVMAFAFFADGMLPTPWTLLGSRRYVNNINGQSVALCGKIYSENWLNEDIAETTASVLLGDARVTIAANSFVAVASAAGIGRCSVAESIKNNCDAQRRHLDEDITYWYRAFEPTMYAGEVQAAFRGVVRRVGSGPWGSGVWWGDSQQYFLTMWLASTLTDSGSFDYYIYDHFCENAGNQCYVLGNNGCSSCISRGGTGRQVDPSRCGSRSVSDVIGMFQSTSAEHLYDKLKNVGGPPTQVFDLM